MTLNPGNAGAVARFLMGVAALTTGTTFVTDYPDSLGQRPQGDLLAALGGEERPPSELDALRIEIGKSFGKK